VPGDPGVLGEALQGSQVIEPLELSREHNRRLVGSGKQEQTIQVWALREEPGEEVALAEVEALGHLVLDSQFSGNSEWQWPRT